MPVSLLIAVITRKEGIHEESFLSTAPVDRGSAGTIQILGPAVPGSDRVITADALRYVAGLIRELGEGRETLLARRREVQRELERGAQPDFLPGTAAVRAGAWALGCRCRPGLLKTRGFRSSAGTTVRNTPFWSRDDTVCEATGYY